ncbi:interleukin-8-like [Arapaima gigas]
MTTHLLLVLLSTSFLLLHDTQALGMGLSLDCLCHSYEARVIPPKSLKSVQILPRGPHCKTTEIITTLTSGQKVCLNPTAPWVKKLIHLMLKKQKHNQKQGLD